MRKFLVTSMVGGVMAAGALLMPANAATTTPATPAGTVTVTAQGGATGGAVAVDGNTIVPLVGNGYIGVDGTTTTGGRVVGCDSGTYTGGTGDNVITAVPPAVPPAQPNPANPCTPGN